MYDTVLFDLDGTLSDSAPGIIAGFQYALRQFGLPEADAAEIRAYIGGPVVENAARYGVPEDRVDEFIRQFRVYYNETGIFENSLYPGVREMLDALRAKGVRLAIATSKPVRAATRVLEYFALSSYFEAVEGSGPEGEVTPKPVAIRRVLQHLALPDGARVVMVGDREYDIQGAAENGIDSIGILHGYGTREELSAGGAKHIAENMEDVTRIALGNHSANEC